VARRKGLQGFDAGQQFHAVVGGFSETARKLRAFFPFQNHRAVSAGPRVAASAAVRVDDHLAGRGRPGGTLGRRGPRPDPGRVRLAEEGFGLAACSKPPKNRPRETVDLDLSPIGAEPLLVNTRFAALGHRIEFFLFGQLKTPWPRVVTRRTVVG